MSGKQFKILNSKINSLLQVVVDIGGKNYVSGVEMEYMMKAQESRLRQLIEGIHQKTSKKISFSFQEL